MKKGVKVLCLIAILVLMGSTIFVLARSNFSSVVSKDIVLCCAQYSASIGGRNEPIVDVHIIISEVSNEIQAPTAYTTDSHGQVYIPFTKGKTYNITAIYKNAKKTSRLKYNGEDTLFISINPYELSIYDIDFATVVPCKYQNTEKFKYCLTILL